jgi:hypothetical protein
MKPPHIAGGHRRPALRLLLVFLLVIPAAAGCVPRPPLPSSNAGPQCLARLAAVTEAVYRPVAVEPANGGACTIRDPVLIDRAPIAWNRPALTSCALALALVDFEREIVQPAALRHFGELVVRVDHLGAYECRGRAGVTSRWSEHALGDAIDIAGFHLADGRVVSVERDWRGRGPARDFLHAVARDACRRFSVVLTPDSNRAHRDHLHFDVGRYRLCEAGP